MSAPDFIDPEPIDEPYPYVCPECYCVGEQPHAPGCHEGVREERDMFGDVSDEEDDLYAHTWDEDDDG